MKSTLKKTAKTSQKPALKTTFLELKFPSICMICKKLNQKNKEANQSQISHLLIGKIQKNKAKTSRW